MQGPHSNERYANHEGPLSEIDRSSAIEGAGSVKVGLCWHTFIPRMGREHEVNWRSEVQMFECCALTESGRVQTREQSLLLQQYHHFRNQNDQLWQCTCSLPAHLRKKVTTNAAWDR